MQAVDLDEHVFIAIGDFKHFSEQRVGPTVHELVHKLAGRFSELDVRQSIARLTAGGRVVTGNQPSGRLTVRQ